jgi:hypothetical protein
MLMTSAVKAARNRGAANLKFVRARSFRLGAGHFKCDPRRWGTCFRRQWRSAFARRQIVTQVPEFCRAFDEPALSLGLFLRWRGLVAEQPIDHRAGHLRGFGNGSFGARRAFLAWRRAMRRSSESIGALGLANASPIQATFT